MPKPIRTNHRMWIAAWAVLCAAGLAVTAQLNASSTPDSRPAKPVSPECSEYIADIERQLAEARQEGEGDGTLLAFSRVQAGTEGDCDEAIRDHFDGDR